MRISCATKVRGKFLALAAIFHILLTIGLFTAGRLGLAPTQIDRDGIGEFAQDSRFHAAHAERLAESLKQRGFRVWFNDPQPIHVKLYSINVLLFAPLLGVNILTVEPLNLLVYLGIIIATFRLGQVMAGSRGARVAALLVAIWPSVVMHSSQFLRDPLVILAVVTLSFILALFLKKSLSWLRAAICVAVAALAVWVIWNTRPEMWLVILGVNSVATLVLLVWMIGKRRLVPVNLVAVVLLNLVPIIMPRPAAGIVSDNWSLSSGSQSSSLLNRVYRVRAKFIYESRGSGSIIDPEVNFQTPGDVVRYVPRALEIGYLAPFPSSWVSTGFSVGLAGRLVSGVEMALTYVLEVLALIYLWRTRRRAVTWFVSLATLMGMLALGLVVANVGTLYRMRYPFWVLIVVMGAATLVTLRNPWAPRRD